MSYSGDKSGAQLSGEYLMRWATYASFGTAVTLIVITLGAWAITGSVALLSTLVDALTDAVSSVVNMWAVRQALMPPDMEHRFGHGKAEPLAGLGQAAFTLGSGVFLLIEAADRFVHPVPLMRSDIGIAVMVIAIILTLALVQFQNYVVRRTKSVAISAASTHYIGDILINVSVIVSMVIVTLFGWTFVDPLFAVFVSVFLMWNARSIAAESLEMLMDRELPEPQRNDLRTIAMGHVGVLDVHDLRTRQSGQRGFIQIHLEMDGTIPLSRAHEIGDEVERAIVEAYQNFEVIVHHDPV